MVMNRVGGPICRILDTGRPLRVLVAHPFTGPFPGSVKKNIKIIETDAEKSIRSFHDTEGI